MINNEQKETFPLFILRIISITLYNNIFMFALYTLLGVYLKFTALIVNSFKEDTVLRQLTGFCDVSAVSSAPVPLSVM